MSYVVLARRWRPKLFQEVVGQEHITQTLIKAIETNRIGHAYLFTGPRGVGKTSTARILAKALNCHKGTSPNPCNKCPSCKEVSEGRSIDVLEIDGASNRRIDEIRELCANVKFAPARDRFKIYIIDEVHMLTTEAFNALLKTLEEPPQHVKFIFATTAPHKIPLTIMSRCQRFDLRRISIENIIKRLEQIAQDENVKTTEGAMFAIARESCGSMRDAESILDQLISFSEGEIKPEDVDTLLGLVDSETFSNLSQAVINIDTVSALRIIERIIDEGKDIEQFIKSWQMHWRDILMAKMEAVELIELPESAVKELTNQAQHFSVKELFGIIEILTETVDLIRKSVSARIPAEIGVAQITRIKSGNPGYVEQKAGGKSTVMEDSPPDDVPPADDPPSGNSAVDDLPADARPSGGVGVKSVLAVPHTQACGELTLREAREKWPLVLDNVKKEKLVTSAFLMEGTPVDVGGGKIAVAFDEDASFHKESCNRVGNKKLIEKAMNDVFRSKFRLHCVSNSSVGGKKMERIESLQEKEKREAVENISKDPMVKKTMEIFGVKIIDVSEEEKPK